MNTDTRKPSSPEAAVSRAIDDVLAAEKDAEERIVAAVSAAERDRLEATEDARRILARADERIGKIHRKVSTDLQADVARIAKTSGDTDDNPFADIAPARLDRLAAELAQWLTTDADD